MQYNQPYGVSDPNAPYINGNPATGTQGSIPPAASIEYPQREIVNLIADAGLLVPDNADLHQLAKSVQSNLLYSDDDAGTSNQYQVTQTPAPTAYFKYMAVVCKIANTNSGASTLNVNALGPKPIRHIADGTELSAGELRQNAIVCLVYDGSIFHIAWSSSGVSGISGAPVFLTANRNFYVNAATGNDAAYDGSSATVVAGTNHGPFKTLQRAADETVKYNLNGFTMSVYVADGVYGRVGSLFPGGGGYLQWIGNASNPQNVVVTGTNNTAFSYNGTGNVIVQGFTFTTSGSNPSDPCAGIFLAYTRMYLMDSRLNNCSGYMIGVSRAGSIVLSGNITIAGNSTGNPYSSGGFISCFFSAGVETSPVVVPLHVIIPGPVNLSYFVVSNQFGWVNFTWTDIVGYANVTGTKYSAGMNGVISVAGAGVNYYPGTVAGSTGNGGQYA